MVRAAVIGLAFVAASATAQYTPPLPDESAAFDGKEWASIGRDSTGSIWLLRRMDWNSTSTMKVLWVKVDHTADKTVHSRTSMYRFVVRCQYNTLGIANLTEYAANGSVLSNFKDSFGDGASGSPVIPDTMGEALLQRVCTK